jgi:hypothetical protein
MDTMLEFWEVGVSPFALPHPKPISRSLNRSQQQSKIIQQQLPSQTVTATAATATIQSITNMTTKNNTYEAKKNSLIRKAIDDRKTIITMRPNGDNSTPLVFDSEKKYAAYRQRLMKK